MDVPAILADLDREKAQLLADLSREYRAPNGRKIYCKYGHHKHGRVQCLACQRRRQKIYRLGRHQPQPVRTHCLRRHEYSEWNTYRDSRGRRSCRTCQRLNALRRRANANPE